MKRILLLPILIILAAGITFGQDTLTFRQALDIALENNFSIRIAKQLGEIAQNNVSLGNAGMLPKLDARGSYGYSNTDIELNLNTGPTKQVIKQSGNVSNTYNASVELGWTLFDGFAMFVNYDKYRKLREKSDIEIQIAVESLIRNLYVAYYNASMMQQNMKILKNTIQVSNDRLERVINKQTYGTAVGLNVLQARVDLNTDSSMYLQSELALKNYKRNINYYLGRDIGTRFYVQDTLTFTDMKPLEEIRKTAFEKNSSINQAIKQREISELDLEAVKSFYFPRISFTTSYSFNLNTAQAGFMTKNQSAGLNAGVSASINLYDGEKTSIREQNAQIGISIAETRYQDAYNRISLTLDNSYEAYQNSLNLLRFETENLKTARQNFNKSNELFNLGQLSSLEFRTAQLNLLRANYLLIQARIQAKIAEFDILVISGEVLDYL